CTSSPWFFCVYHPVSIHLSCSYYYSPFLFFFFLLIPLPPISTLFPYTTLFRSFVNEEDHDVLKQGEVLVVDNLKEKLKEGEPFEMHVEDSTQVIKVNHNLSEAQIELIKQGGVINQVKAEI